MYVLIAPWATPPDGQFPVMHLSSCSEYRKIAPPNSIGFVSSSLEFPGEHMVVTCDYEPWNREILLHEFAHVLNYRCFPLSPVWVTEGLATYFESMEVVDGRAFIGKVPTGKAHLWRRPDWGPKLPELLALDYHEFHGDQNERNYFAAWKLVHMLNNTSPDYQNRFRGFLAMLNGQRERKNVWELAFHGIPPKRLADEYRVYQLRSEVRLWTTSYQLEDPPAASVRRLRAGEARAVWAHLVSRTNPDEALRQLDLAAQADPEWPDVFYWRALLLPWVKQPGANEQAAAALREYRTRRPDDVRGWHALLSMELGRVVPAGHLGVEDTTPAGLEDLEWIAKGLMEHAMRPSDLNLAAWYYAMSRRAEAGLPLAIQSVQRDPGCADCWDTLALLYFQNGDAARALLAQERAANMQGDGRIGRGVQARLQRYRVAASVGAQ
ncbi:MAG TPA: DUF1570 domain-containing protein [Kofleriaceae bacterium]